jgi:hypothetical protein
MCFVTAPFFEPVALSAPCERASASLICGGRVRDLVELAVDELAVVADRRAADELADLLRVLGRDLLATSANIPPTSLRASSRGGRPCSSAQAERPRAQNSSSSSKFRSLPFVK